MQRTMRPNCTRVKREEPFTNFQTPQTPIPTSARRTTYPLAFEYNCLSLLAREATVHLSLAAVVCSNTALRVAVP